MKVQKLKTKKMLILSLGVIIFIVLFMLTKTMGMQDYEKIDFSTGLVTAKTLNVRQGPGLNYKVIAKINKDTYIRVFAKIGNWYVIQTENDILGAVSDTYIQPIYPTEQTTTEPENVNNVGADSISAQQTETQANVQDESTATLTENEKEVFNLINAKRIEAGLQALKIDNDVQNTAKIKAKDMVDNAYFAHNSPTYGTPFEMLKKFSITYRTAGENIAGNSSNENAVTAWMNSEGHKENILNTAYNYTGIAVVDSAKYGKIYVQFFIGK